MNEYLSRVQVIERDHLPSPEVIQSLSQFAVLMTDIENPHKNRLDPDLPRGLKEIIVTAESAESRDPSAALIAQVNPLGKVVIVRMVAACTEAEEGVLAELASATGIEEVTITDFAARNSKSESIASAQKVSQIVTGEGVGSITNGRIVKFK